LVVAVLSMLVVDVISLAPHPVTWVQKEMVDVVVVAARLLSVWNSS
jgi:hypothetical protein